MGATECFPLSDSLLPKVLLNVVGEGVDADETFYAVTGNDEFILYGGITQQRSLSTLNEINLGIIVRMDLSKHTRRWGKTINGDMKKTPNVGALALKQDEGNTKFAAYLFDHMQNSFADGSIEGYVMIFNS